MCAVEARWHLGAKDFEGARRARRSVKGLLEPLNMPRQEVEDVELVVGELTGNALRYTDGSVQIVVYHCDVRIQVAVVDQGDCFDPAVAVMNDPSSEGDVGSPLSRLWQTTFNSKTEETVA